MTCALGRTPRDDNGVEKGAKKAHQRTLSFFPHRDLRHAKGHQAQLEGCWGH
jgi:hypothetical protein